MNFKHNRYIIGLITISLFLLATIAINQHIIEDSYLYIDENIEQLNEAQAVMILGAKVFNSGRLSDTLKDRADTAYEVYKNEKANKILISGDNSSIHYNEVHPVRDYLLTKGVPANDIFIDYAGFDTYDSMYRAQAIFNVNNLIISTQDFHLPRAVFIAKQLGINTQGIKADRRKYIHDNYNNRREFLARIKSFLDITFHSKPKFLGEQFDITGDGKESWAELDA